VDPLDIVLGHCPLCIDVWYCHTCSSSIHRGLRLIALGSARIQMDLLDTIHGHCPLCIDVWRCHTVVVAFLGSLTNYIRFHKNSAGSSRSSPLATVLDVLIQSGIVIPVVAAFTGFSN